MMAYTVIAAYDAYDQAQAALDELLSRGYARHKLHLGLVEDARWTGSGAARAGTGG
jgi:hypothetical protein